MRKILVRQITAVVAVTVLILGVPATLFAASYLSAQLAEENWHYQMLWEVGRLVLGMVVLSLIALAVGIAMAVRRAGELSAPLVYLAASAEQLGGGNVRPHVATTGIEEIDLVYQEIERTADRLAGRLSAERQFSADVAHQLRTPLSALSMRLEEIQYLTDSDDVREEAEAALGQVERLTGVVNELMRGAQREITTRPTDVREVFVQQKAEWSAKFAAEGRALTFVGGECSVLSAPGSLSQILATLIENSLVHGDGETRVSAVAAGRHTNIKVIDEGAGVAPEIADDIFDKGYSGAGSTGIGLAVARELAQADGGRLTLTSMAPAEFTITLMCVPTSLAPQQVLPTGSLVFATPRRKRR
ncbi:signal transduction histidine kinase [Arcanobacterium wilhelmae]|uniref:Signal transduction histidine-protein kinase/phosphatase MprB n=1 Tax=Arcanobacterium wilhelmae TaxID=1803177 RepID=A0ABT9NC75_9ACTO|nr:HAMP domain-containing sensor histidine kinase [Arcanobacterium wilhelmae]MDP9801329.1 signal transduction histidine kinase [Arcanobacterium wilhelmae]WFN90668.1 HAMP domain-containing sensor histidine kinase [Arcanobacterium wilhelmae]